MLAATSVLYVAFAIVVAGLYALAPRPARPPLLLLASLGFYASFNWMFLFLLLAVIAAAYVGGRAIAAAPQRRGRLWIGVGIVLLPLIFYKYLIVWISALRGALIPTSTLDFGGYGAVLIPVGLSFFTFQCLGYLFDVAKKTATAERDPARFALFVAFFPILLSGPIERWGSLSKQLIAANRASPNQTMDGLLLMAWGLAMKLVVGDALGTYVDAVFAVGRDNATLSVWAGLIAFVVQLYADFCGYTLIALGTGKLFGIELTPNFRQPLLARNILDFWQRWHISLTRWIGDYIYRPLALRLVKVKSLGRGGQELAALFATWIAMGLWHGANFTFVLFGALQALLVFGHGQWARRFRRKPGPARSVIGWALTMAAIVLTFGLIRADTVAHYAELLAAGLQWTPGLIPFSDWRKVLAGLALIAVVDLVRRFRPGVAIRSVEGRAVLIGLLALAVILYGHEQSRAFIYFRF